MDLDASSQAPSPSPASRLRHLLSPSNRFSTISSNSVFSFSSIRTALPEYSETLNVNDVPYTDIRDPPPSIDDVSPSASGFSTVLSSSSLPRSPTASEPASVPPGVVSHFEYVFPLRRDKPWATLVLFARKFDPHTLNPSRPAIPQFWSGDQIRGLVELDFGSSQTLHSILIRIRGRLLTSSFTTTNHTFFEHSKLLWRKEDGPPPRTEETPTQSATDSKFNGKVSGKYGLPFSYPFPTSGAVDGPLSPPPFPSPFIIAPILRPLPTSDEKPGHTLQPPVSTRPTDTNLPASFSERDLPVSIQYELEVEFQQGRFTPNSRISTPIAYFPSVIPPCMSAMRRRAYQEGALLPGPSSDPAGWMKFPAAVILGNYGPQGSQKRVRVDSTLYLANPLFYTRGSVVPCYLTLASQDASTLDIFASLKVPYVRLVRQLRYFKIYDPSEMQGANAVGPISATTSPLINSADMNTDRDQRLIQYKGKVGYMDLVETECNAAVWWKPPKDTPQEEGVRRLEGEIHLPKDLVSNCDLDVFRVEYLVEVLPPALPYFTPLPRFGSQKDAKRASKTASKSSQAEALVSQPIRIATLYAGDSPVPTSFSKPVKVRRK